VAKDLNISLAGSLKRAQSKTMPDLQHEGARIGGGAIYGQLLVLPVADRPNKTATAVGEYDMRKRHLSMNALQH